ncbi:MAG: tape measure protein, partial [Gemmiger sp.]
QYVQALSRGKFEMEEWKTMQETMGLALNRVAESFGYVGESAQTDLYNALKEGEITFTQFNDRLIQLNNGVGGFAELAKTSSAGIKTAWTNMGTAMVRGTTTMIEALDAGLSETKFESIQNVIETTGEVIEDSMGLAAPAIELVASHADTLVISLGALTVAYGANKAVKAFTTAQEAAVAATIAAEAAGKILVPTLKAQTLEETAATGAISLKNFALVAMTGSMNLATVASGLLTAATTALSTAINVLLGPVGLAVLAIGAVAAGAVAVYNAVTAESEAFTEQSEILDDLASTQENLAKSEESNAKAADNNLKSIRANADAAGELAKELGALDSVENKSASQKQRMGEMVDELNEKYADLCLTYDEEADQLSMNAEQLQAYIDAQQTMEEVSARQERYNELLDEEAAIRQNMAELESMQTEWAAQLEQKVISQGEYNELMEQSKETLAAYAAQEQALGDQRKALDEELAAIDTTTAQTVINNAQAQQEATRAAAEAETAEMERRKEALQSYTEAATNMYDTIDTKSELSVQQMIENMQANQEAVATWADNLVALGERGLDQGLLQQLRDAGPESAATVAELVTATDEQLVTLSETFRAGGEAAATALQTELGLPEVTNSGSEMVDTIAAGVSNNTALTDATTQMINDAVSTAKPLAQSGGQEIGTQMDNGIVAGIAAGRAGVINAMVQTVRDAIAAAAAEAEIHSPSRVMEDFIGLNLMKGWAKGEEKGTDLVVEKAVAAMNAVRAAFNSGSLNPTQIVATMRANVIANQSRLTVPESVASAASERGKPTTVIENRTQNIYFEQPMQAPDEIARALRIQQTYGLAGAR